VCRRPPPLAAEYGGRQTRRGSKEGFMRHESRRGEGDMA
jgi:hypothetical protein